MTTAAIDLEGLLKAGIEAYRQGNYAKAIASLSKLSRCPSQTYRIKAGMGLVRVYMAQKDWAKAKSLCTKISHGSQPAVQQWAAATLRKIEERAEPVAQDISGFQPLSSEPSRLVPLEKLNQKKSNQIDEAQLPESSVSMFHYAYLNGDEEVESEAEEPDIDRAAIVQTDSPSYEWPNAGRLPRGRSLGKMKRSQLWFAQTIGAITFYSLLLYLVHSAVSFYNGILNFIDNFLSYRLMNWLPFKYASENYGYWSWRLLTVLLVVAIASPWLWDLCLRFTANRQPFSNQKLRTHSSEAATLIGKRCQQRRWPFPTLWKLPTDVPLIFSYGWLPRNARLVVSEGFLTQLSADEIATLVSYEMSHWKTWYWPLLSIQGLILQLFHQLYWQLALWGDQKSKPLNWIAGAIATVSYAVFWMLRLPLLWVSRVRTYYGDRVASELTGNPNGLARALAKLSFYLAASVEKQGYTPILIEQTGLLLPVSVDLARHALYGTVPLPQLFAWDSLNSLRSWMSVSNSHPPLGDRLRLIMAYSRHWKLNLEVPLEASLRRKQALSKKDWVMLIGQGMPFVGGAFGLIVGSSLLLLGAIGRWQEWPVIDWMHKDPKTFWFCFLMGAGLGTMLRINRFFPDLSFDMPQSAELTQWISEPSLLPIDSLPTKLSGSLLGRPGIANWLGQDLILSTPVGLLKLHFFSVLGPLGNAIGKHKKLSTLLGEPVQVLGWFRRGNQVWIDIDKVRLSDGTVIKAAHPIASLIIAIATTGLGLWLLGFGQFFQELQDKMIG